MRTVFAMLRDMHGLMRYTAIALGVLVLALLFAVCGEVGACSGCLHEGCVLVDRRQRRESVTCRVIRAVRRGFAAAMPRVLTDVRVALAPATPLFQSQVLEVKMAQLRV